jgi:uncharacterized Fe-S center protein
MEYCDICKNSTTVEDLNLYEDVSGANTTAVCNDCLFCCDYCGEHLVSGEWKPVMSIAL